MQTSGRQRVLDLFSEHRDRLHWYLRSRLANDADAQELAQEAYLRLLRISQTELIKNPHAYLYRIATNLVNEIYAEYLTTSQRVGEEVLNELEAPDPSPEQAVTRRRQMQQIEQAMGELPPKCRAVVTMRGRLGMTNPEIAKRLGISVEMVKKYMSMGVAHCRKRLSRFRDDADTKM